jgi:hypothetical protein
MKTKSFFDNSKMGDASMSSNGMSLRQRFLLGVVACAVLPLIIVSMVAYRGLMTNDVTIQEHLNSAKKLLDQAPQGSEPGLTEEFAAMEKELVALSLKNRRSIIISSVLSIIVIAALGAILARSVTSGKQSPHTEKSPHPPNTELEDQFEEMRKKLGDLLDDSKQNGS